MNDNINDDINDNISGNTNDNISGNIYVRFALGSYLSRNGLILGVSNEYPFV